MRNAVTECDSNSMSQTQRHPSVVKERGEGVTPYHCSRRCPWPILRRSVDIQSGRVAALHKLPFPRGLCGQGSA